MRQWKQDVLADSETIAKKLLKNPAEQVLDSGDNFFAGVLLDGRDTLGYYVSQIGDHILVASFYKKTETIGRTDPEIEVSENTYVETHYYWLDEFDFSQDPEEALQTVREQTVEQYPNEKGWLHGHRLKSLKRAVSDLELPD